jgi:hypothetical protein
MKEKVIEMLESEMISRRKKALLSLKLLTSNPVGIGDHSTDDFYDFYNNCTEALINLAEADDALETLNKYKDEL